MSLTELTRRRAELQSHYDDQTLWLREIATHFSSTEEQQRISSDIVHTLDELHALDAQIESCREGAS